MKVKLLKLCNFLKRKNIKILVKKISISGSTFALTILKTMCLLLIIFIILFVLYKETILTNSSQSIFRIIGDFFYDNFETKDIVEILLSFITIIASTYACRQIYLMKDINRTEMCHEIYKADQKYRMKAHDAQNQLLKLTEFLNQNKITVESEKELLANEKVSTFHNILIEEDYEILRSFAYHYEYIGYLTLRDKLNFNVAFDTITFPNWLIVSDDAKKIIEIGRVFTPDFWNGSEYLYRSYEVRRKHNAHKIDFNNKDIKAKYKSACKKWEEKYSQLV